MRAGRAAPDELPLSPNTLVVLAALAEGPLPGIDILQSAAGPGVRILGPGTLYRLLRDLRRNGCVERVSTPPSEAGTDDRRQYYALTPHGRRLLSLETERLAAVLAQARKGLARSGGR